MFEACPKCGYQRQAADTGSNGICAACGLVFAKWVQRQNVVAPSRTDAAEGAESEGEATPARRLWEDIAY